MSVQRPSRGTRDQFFSGARRFDRATPRPLPATRGPRLGQARPKDNLHLPWRERVGVRGVGYPTYETRFPGVRPFQPRLLYGSRPEITPTRSASEACKSFPRLRFGLVYDVIRLDPERCISAILRGHRLGEIGCTYPPIDHRAGPDPDDPAQTLRATGQLHRCVAAGSADQHAGTLPFNRVVISQVSAIRFAVNFVLDLLPLDSGMAGHCHKAKHGNQVFSNIHFFSSQGVFIRVLSVGLRYLIRYSGLIRLSIQAPQSGGCQ